MLGFRDNFMTKQMLRRSDMANSPFHRAIFDMEEKRSNLFLDRRRIPGRKAKLLIGFGLLCQLYQFLTYGVKKHIEIKQFMKKRELEISKLQRKSAPFLQAMNDLRYLALEERKNMIVQELLADLPQDNYKNLTQRFHQDDIWAPYSARYKYMYNKTNRNVRSYFDMWFARYCHGYDKFNI